MKVTIKHCAASDKTYRTNIPLKNIAEIRIDNSGGYMFRLLDGPLTWYHVPDKTGKEIEKFIYNEEKMRGGEE